MNSYTIIVFGITGDLAKRKIIPALYNKLKKSSDNFSIIGVAIDQKDIVEIYHEAKKFIENYDEEVFNKLISISSYCKVDIKKSTDYISLKEQILKQENKFNLSDNRLFYCAVSSEFFIDITKNLSENEIIKRINDDSNAWHRIAFEKPFGHNLSSAKRINEVLHKYLDESQIFRVDHYLLKEIVDNITFVRFTNRVFEPLWNNQQIDSIQIILDESIGLEGRGSYYDKFGAIKDVVQNHMLQLVSLVAMEAPAELYGDYIRDAKVEILKRIIPVGGLLGQYVNFKKEKNVSPNSKTETFAVIKLLINNEKWQGVPFYLKTGKFLDKKSTKIVVRFKYAYCLLSASCPIEPNYLIISIFPEEGIKIEINTKKPHSREKIISAKLDFCYSCLFEPESYQTYESILDDIIKGEKSISVRQDEIEYSWKITDQILSMNLPLFEYKQGTKGPIEAYEFAIKNNFEWK